MRFLKFIGLIVVICFLVDVVSRLNKPDTTPHEASEAPTLADAQVRAKELALANVKHQISIAEYNWWTDGFSSIMMATFKFKNDSDFAGKDIEVECRHSGDSGTIMDSNTRTIYQIVPAHKILTVRKFDMGFINSQATHSSCTITDLITIQ